MCQIIEKASISQEWNEIKIGFHLEIWYLSFW